jgi:hypothetical protein
MSAPGIAGSRRPEREGIFLRDDDFDVDFFVRMAGSRGVAADVWAVNVDDYWIENGPRQSLPTAFAYSEVAHKSGRTRQAPPSQPLQASRETILSRS